MITYLGFIIQDPRDFIAFYMHDVLEIHVFAGFPLTLRTLCWYLCGTALSF